MNSFKNSALEKNLNISEIDRIIFQEPDNNHSDRFYKAFCFFTYEGLLVGYTCNIPSGFIDSGTLDNAREKLLKSYKERFDFAKQGLNTFYYAKNYKQCAMYIDSLAYATNLCLKNVIDFKSFDKSGALLGAISENSVSKSIKMLEEGTSTLDIYKSLILNVSSNKLIISEEDVGEFISLNKLKDVC